MTTKASSPSSTGPAGSHFEGQIGAHYMLSMLLGTEPRGLPGTSIDRIELQRAAEGRPLDDVIVHAHDSRGNPAVLEIQVKRKASFTPTDSVFREVVGQIVEASRRSDFESSRYELAIATARTSRKIDGPYQDVLTWARQLGDAETFITRINRAGSANDDMRTFVRTFKSNLQHFGASDDNETVWRLLRRFQIIVFDFTAQNSVSEELAKERAVRALHTKDTPQAGKLWSVIVNLALQIAISGGDRTRDMLIEDLRNHSFRLTGDRRYFSARAALDEAAQNALRDISNCVGDVVLTRHERITSIHAALDNGRYVEIRGDAGVGKSGILKYFAAQIATEAKVIVLSPGRTTPKGWVAMRAVINFDGTARDLLTDLAGDGGAILFVDNLDFFDDEERMTVVDLVREAANIPGFSVITTARRNFGVEEPSWLPADALNHLGRSEPIIISELSKAEVDELRHIDTRLASLLTDNHPARAVTRNLFRLARLANYLGDEPVPHTEIDMAVQWWKTADGRDDGNRRERSRVLKILASQALTSAEPLDVSNYSSKAVDSLIASETLRDLGNDRVTFRHDVLREWAIANLLHIDSNTIEHLSLERPASVALARGVELASRMAIEWEDDSLRWKSLVERFSQQDVNGSWRRAVLLGLVRSEIGTELLARASDLLLVDRASMLRELIRIIIAVDVEPATKLFTTLGIDPTLIPASLNVPSGSSWYSMISWLLSLEDRLPVAAIPDVVDLYTAWSSGTLGIDPITPSLIQWFYSWLTKIEGRRDSGALRDQPDSFFDELDYDRINSLKTDLRTGFFLFCNQTPSLAVKYLRSLSQRRHNENDLRRIMKFSGAFAQAAPAELAELTASALISETKHNDRHHPQVSEEPFTFLDHEFLPASPAQGPFFNLLTHSPQHGLLLINRLVSHVISFYSRNKKHGSDSITIPLPDGNRTFHWSRSYAWSRERVCREYSVTSALMALEAWAHRRIEAGDSFDIVLTEVLGQPDLPAAYLLVAVDLILSHWPKSREMAVYFLACPELLCIDEERHQHDNFEYPDIYGLKALQKEPVSTVSAESLKKRPSRRSSLSQVLGQYAVFESDKLRELLTDKLLNAAERLGLPDEQSDLGDPEFMVVHALNLVDPKNWHEELVPMADGSEKMAWKYLQPETEIQHLAPLQEASRKKFENINMQIALGSALEDPSHSSPEFAVAAVKWAKSPESITKGKDKDEHWMHEQTIVIAAMIVMRDGTIELRTEHEEWARGIFSQALLTKEDSVHRFRSGLRFNPIAIAFVGMVYLFKDSSSIEDLKTLLEVSARDDPAAAHGFSVTISILDTIDQRLPRAILRCAFTACIRSHKWNLDDEEVAKRSRHHQQQVKKCINAELAWLNNECPEPEWPTFPSKEARCRHPIRISGENNQREEVPTLQQSGWEESADQQAAALWLSMLKGFMDVTKQQWLCEISHNYVTWTAEANGAGLDASEQITNKPNEWNSAFFDLLAYSLPELSMAEIEQLVLVPLSSLPDESFFDIITLFLRSIDDIYFNEHSLKESIAISIRSALANRLMASNGWKRLGDSRSSSIEMHIGPAIAVFFFNDYGYTQSTKCYLFPKAIDRLDPFLTVLEILIESGASLFVALVVLNLLEVSPRPSHLQFIVVTAKAWLENYPDNVDFWVNHGIGRRMCVLIENIRCQNPSLLDSEKEARSSVDKLLAALIAHGVADAKRLEMALTI